MKVFIKHNAPEWTLENFTKVGCFQPCDFNFVYRVRRIRYERPNKSMFKKVFAPNAKPADYEKYAGKLFTKTNSWYYALVVECPEFELFIHKELNTSIPAEKRKVASTAIQNSYAFGIIKGLTYAKQNFNTSFPNFKSLKHCQEWCDKHHISIDVRQVYEETKKYDAAHAAAHS